MSLTTPEQAAHLANTARARALRETAVAAAWAEYDAAIRRSWGDYAAALAARGEYVYASVTTPGHIE